jgi:hypothetical protein
MEYFEVITDANTGEQTIRPYTDEEIAVVVQSRFTTMRAVRDHKLASEVDPIVSNPLRWADLTAEKQAEWAAYRRALLDITAQSGFPHDIAWPTKPE